MTSDIKVGALPWGQRIDWASLQHIGQRADELGYDSLWTWDHLYPIQGDWRGPIFEGYLILAGWAAVTSRATLGLMVGANTFRNPALTVKLATTLDHMSNGRAILGIGGAWFEREHEAFGIEFGSGFGERLTWLDEAAELMRDMLRDGTATARGPRYQAASVRNDPPPIQPRLPILIGGDGEKKTLATVARYADIVEHRRRPRVRPPQGRGPPAMVRAGRARRVRDRANARPGPVDHPRRSGRGAAGRRRDPRASPGLQRSAADRDGGTDRRIARAVSSGSGSGTSSTTSRRRTTRRRWSGSSAR